MKILTLAAASAFAFAPITATADEVWETSGGPITYLQDMGAVAVWSFPYLAAWPGNVPEFANPVGTLYFPGLGGNFDDRSIHDGYWAVVGSPACSASLTTPEGVTTSRWGRARVIFDNPAFPTSLTLLVGSCFDEPTQIIRGERP